MACEKALERLKDAQKSNRACLKYNICPNCGENIVRVGVDGEYHVKRCMSCGQTYAGSEL